MPELTLAILLPAWGWSLQHSEKELLSPWWHCWMAGSPKPELTYLLTLNSIRCEKSEAVWIRGSLPCVKASYLIELVNRGAKIWITCTHERSNSWKKDSKARARINLQYKNSESLAVQKRTTTTWFHLREITRVIKIMKTESRMMVARGWRRGIWWVFLFMSIELQLCKINKFRRSVIQHYQCS